MSIINKITSFVSEIAASITFPSQTKEGSARYNEITRRVPHDELSSIEQKLASMSPNLKQQGIIALIGHVNKGEWDKIDFKDPNTPLYALEAVKRGLMLPMQFGTLQMFWSSAEFHGMDKLQKISIFLPGGAINSEARALVWETMKSPFQSNPVISEKQMDEFFEKMRSLPVSERYFLLSPRTVVENEYEESETVIDVLHDSLGFNIFGICGKNKEMVPSFGMMQTLLDVRFQNQASTLNPVLGLSTNDDLEHLTLRDVAVAFPGVVLPKDADDILAPAHIFSYHDGVYHANLGSAVPLRHRELFNKMGRIAEKCGFSEFRGTLVDREFRPYSENLKTADLTPVFWITMKSMMQFKAKLNSEEKNRFFAFVWQHLGNDPIIKAGKPTILEMIR